MDRTNKPEQFLVLTDAWGILRKYLNADEDSCNQALKDYNNLHNSFGSDFAKDIAIACVNEIDRIVRNKEKGNGKER